MRVCDRDFYQSLKMPLKSLSVYEKRKRIERLTHVPLCRIDTKITESDLEEEDIQKPCTLSSLNKKSQNQKSSAQQLIFCSVRRKVDFQSVKDQDFNTTFKQLNEELYQMTVRNEKASIIADRMQVDNSPCAFQKRSEGTESQIKFGVNQKRTVQSIQLNISLEKNSCTKEPHVRNAKKKVKTIKDKRGLTERNDQNEQNIIRTAFTDRSLDQSEAMSITFIPSKNIRNSSCLPDHEKSFKTLKGGDREDDSMQERSTKQTYASNKLEKNNRQSVETNALSNYERKPKFHRSSQKRRSVFLKSDKQNVPLESAQKILMSKATVSGKILRSEKLYSKDFANDHSEQMEVQISDYRTPPMSSNSEQISLSYGPGAKESVCQIKSGKEEILKKFRMVKQRCVQSRGRKPSELSFTGLQLNELFQYYETAVKYIQMHC